MDPHYTRDSSTLSNSGTPTDSYSLYLGSAELRGHVPESGVIELSGSGSNKQVVHPDLSVPNQHVGPIIISCTRTDLS